MATSTATVLVEARYDGSQAAKGLQQTAKQTESAFDGLKKAAGGLAIGAVIGKVVGDAISAASDLQQAMGGTDLIFKDSAKAIHDWAKDTSDNFRVPAVEAEKFAATMGNALMQAGMSTDEAVSKTKELAQVGADLAAAFGGSTVEALDAINAAIAKGEFERLESFGVTIKQADITAEMNKIAGGADKITVANKAAIETQARINLLMKEAAPAMGAAASEADSYAAKQEAFNEQWQNFLAVIGGPLLNTLGGFMDLLSSMLPVITPLITGIANLATAAAALPGPVLAAGAAFAVWQKFNLGSVFSALSGSIRGFVGEVGAIKQGVRDAGGEISTLGAAAAANDGKLGGLFKTIAAGGAAIAAGFALEFIIDEWKEFTDGAENAREALEAVFDELVKTGGEWDAYTRRLLIATVSSSDLYKELVAGGADATLALRALTGDGQALIELLNSGMVSGGLVDDVVEFTGYAAVGMSAAAKATAEANNALAVTEGVVSGVTGVVEGMVGAWGAVEAAALPTIEQISEAWKRTGDSLKEAADTTDLQSALDDVGDSAKAAGDHLDYINQQIDAFTGRTPDIDAATVAWQKLIMPPPAAKEGQEQQLSVIQKYLDTVKGGVPVLNDWNTKLLGQSDAGQELFAQFEDLKGGYDDIISAAYEHGLATGDSTAAMAEMVAASKDTRASFTEWAAPLQAAGVNVDQLANRLGILDLTELSPKLLEVIMADEAAQAALAQFEAIHIDPKKITITADIPATAEIESAITYVDEATGEVREIKLDADPKTATDVVNAVIADINGRAPTELKVGADTSVAQAAVNSLGTLFSGIQAKWASGTTAKVTVTSNATEVQAQINTVAKGSYSATVVINGNTAPVGNAIRAVIGGQYSLMVVMNGNPGPVNNVIRAVTGGSYSLTIVMNGNTVPVNNAIRAVIGGSYSLTITINGNNAPALGAIRAVTGASHTATVTVTANTAPFYAAYNALPTTRAVTLTQTVVTVAAPAPAAATASLAAFAPTPTAGLRAAAAPTAGPQYGGAGATTQQAGTVNITIQGAVDPDSTARQIESLLRRRERRRTVVAIQRPGTLAP